VAFSEASLLGQWVNTRLVVASTGFLGPPVIQEKKSKNHQEDNSRHYHFNRHRSEIALIVHDLQRILCL
jgi:hypothetical protein